MFITRSNALIKRVCQKDNPVDNDALIRGWIMDNFLYRINLFFNDADCVM